MLPVRDFPRCRRRASVCFWVCVCSVAGCKCGAWIRFGKLDVGIRTCVFILWDGHWYCRSWELNKISECQIEWTEILMVTTDENFVQFDFCSELLYYAWLFGEIFLLLFFVRIFKLSSIIIALRSRVIVFVIALYYSLFREPLCASSIRNEFYSFIEKFCWDTIQNMDELVALSLWKFDFSWHEARWYSNYINEYI